MIYAELDEGGACKNILRTFAVIDAPNMIEIESYDTSLLGQIYNLGDGTWSPGPAPPTAPPSLEEKVDALGVMMVQMMLK
ncbi:MAG: hypothetical protein ABFD08_08130 [Syntrophomonas sp.]